MLATSLDEVEGARRVECGDGPLWLVETERAQRGGGQLYQRSGSIHALKRRVSRFR